MSRVHSWITAGARACVLLFAALPATAAIPQAERDALIAIYNSTNGPGWTNSTNWLGAPGTECTWFGVGCDFSGTKVDGLDLDENALAGTIPSEIGNLIHLQSLNLSINQLSGSIPSSIGELTQLRGLSLHRNQLAGAIPESIGNFSLMQTLWLQSNQLSGPIPSSLGNLGELYWLHLSDNRLSGPIPPEIGNLGKLNFLWLRQNELSGTIPVTLANLTSLVAIDISWNRLTGTIPAELASLPNITSLNIGANALTGTIPPELGNLTKLSLLGLHYNQLEGAIPPSLANLQELRILWLERNNLVGEIPPAFATLTKIDGPNLYGDYYNLALGLNGLYTNSAAVRAWADARQPGWSATQTVAPTNLAVSSSTTFSVSLSWTPISFTANSGRYEVRVDAGTGTFYFVSTTSKSQGGLTVSGLQAGKSYTFMVRTVTDPHPDNPDNSVVSEFSAPVTVTTPSGPRPTISTGDMVTAEGNIGQLIGGMSVVLSNPYSSPVTVEYATGNGTATAGADYLPLAATTLTFAPGETMKVVLVTILGDVIDESDETFFLYLSNATNATIADGTSVVTIMDDDQPLSVSISDLSVVEGNAGTTTGSFSVSLSRSLELSESVHFATSDGSAFAGHDYIATAGTITFNPGETTKTLSVEILSDTTEEADESFVVTLSGATNAAIADAQGVGTIIDDDHSPRISVSSTSVLEGDAGFTQASPTVSLSFPWREQVRVDWQTASGSATGGSDFHETPLATVSFEPGETAKILTVTVVGDTAIENEEYFFVRLSNPVNATIADGQGEIVIGDDDAPPAQVPDPSIVVDGCTRIGGQCTFSARSASGADISNWSYEWSLNGVAASRGTIWSPGLSQAGTYGVSLKVMNSAGSGSAATTIRLEGTFTCPLGTLCTLGGRFQLSLTARDHRTGATGLGLSTQKNDISGFFSIPALTFDASNPEVFVKVLDGRPVNGNFWVFFGGLTDLEYTLTLNDSVAGTSKSYTKPGGSSQGGFDVGSGVAPETCQGEVDGTPRAAGAPTPCVAGSDRHCLNAGRFRVTLAARDPRTGATGSGLSIPGSDLFGYFSIPALTNNQENPEVFVKVLDGHPINGYFWIFFSGLTDLGYTLTVTDTATGIAKDYTKSPGSACGAFDSNAF